MRILIADDDPVSRRLLERTLEGLGHKVLAVPDGSTALAAILGPDGPQLAILDWMMPGADGLTVCRTVREHAAQYVYIIILTGRHRRDDMVAALDAGVDEFLTKPFDALELRARLRSGERVLDLQEGLLKAQERLRQQATHDGLTGLWNRSMVLDQLAIELTRAARENQPLSIAMADIDQFKRINDSYGHAAGDAVLQAASTRMRSVLRGYDGLARYGGEEFLLLLPGCEADAALDIAERARAVVASEPAAAGNVMLPMTISIGVACTTDGHWEADALIGAADQALYRAKALGRNRVEVWMPAAPRSA